MTVRILTGDARVMLATLPDASVQCVVTSPPYYGLRDYGTATWSGGDPDCDHTGVRREHNPNDKQATSAGSSRDPVRRECRLCGARRTDAQIGLEPTPDAYVAEMVAVFREVRRVLRDDGTLWLNLGDSYAGSWGARGRGGDTNAARPDLETKYGTDAPARQGYAALGIKPKDLLGIPWAVAFALRADGWWLRSDIIWAKPNPMPESVTDRPTSAHEHVFLLSKRERYYWDAEAVREPFTGVSDVRVASAYAKATGKSPTREYRHVLDTDGRNIRNVWTIATQPFSGAHFATMPPDLAERCIKAGSKLGDAILDPFGGAGTTGLVADRLGRNAILIELNPLYATLARDRLRGDCPMFAEPA